MFALCEASRMIRWGGILVWLLDADVPSIPYLSRPRTTALSSTPAFTSPHAPHPLPCLGGGPRPTQRAFLLGARIGRVLPRAPPPAYLHAGVKFKGDDPRFHRGHCEGMTYKDAVPATCADIVDAEGRVTCEVPWMVSARECVGDLRAELDELATVLSTGRETVGQR